MTTSLSAAAFATARGLKFGPLRATPYGLCAAVGLILGMTLARGAAARLRLDQEAVWNTGIFALISCFLASRLLLVLRNPVAFRRYPLLVLGLPSLTTGGMLVAALLLLAYVRVRRRLTLLAVLDVFAAPGALLAAALELGHFLDGSEVGMPSAMPWAVRNPWAGNGSAFAAPVHPVGLYGVALALAIAVGLWQLLPRRLGRGRVAAWGLMLGGAAAFGLNLLTEPLLIPPELPLEPGQWMALGAMLGGAFLWSFAPVGEIQAEETGAGPAHSAAGMQVRDELGDSVAKRETASEIADRRQAVLLASGTNEIRTEVR